MSKESVEAWNGIFVECTVYSCPYEPPSMDGPGCPAECYIEEVYLNEEDITDNLSPDFLGTLMERIESGYEPDYEAMAEDRRDGRRDDAAIDREIDYMTRDKSQ